MITFTKMSYGYGYYFDIHNSSPLSKRQLYLIMYQTIYNISLHVDELVVRRYTPLSKWFIMSSCDNNSTITMLPYDIIIHIAQFIYE